MTGLESERSGDYRSGRGGALSKFNNPRPNPARRAGTGAVVANYEIESEQQGRK
jgi:hypothetical protein